MMTAGFQVRLSSSRVKARDNAGGLGAQPRPRNSQAACDRGSNAARYNVASVRFPGEAFVWPGATREHARRHVTEEATPPDGRLARKP